MNSRVRYLTMIATALFMAVTLFLILPKQGVEANQSTLWSKKYDASRGYLHNLPTEANGINYTGSGYVAHWFKNNQYVDINVTIPKDGYYTFTFRYSAAAGSAVRNLQIGDSYEVERLRLGGTNSWDDFATATVESIFLKEGTHKVSLIYNSAKGSKNYINYDQLIVSETDSDKTFNWVNLTNAADLAQKSLYKSFWNSSRRIFNFEHDKNSPTGLHYWWQAHAVDTLVDGYERTGDDVYLERASTLLNGIYNNNWFRITNDYYDDMLWLALSTLRLYEHTGNETHKSRVFTLWDDIKTGWNNAQGGGIAWRKTQLDFKNTPSNAPAIILAARLYQKFGNDEDLEWAKKIYNWQKRVLVDPRTGIVWDGINSNGDGRISKDWLFTYNQGVYIGANVELFRATNDSKYLNAAHKTANTVVNEFADHNGVIFEHGTNDGGLFKGILIRYLTNLVLESPSQIEVINVILQSAKSAWNHVEGDKSVLFGASWVDKPKGSIELSQHLSGVMLMEQAAIVIENIYNPSFAIVKADPVKDIVVKAGSKDITLPRQTRVLANDGKTYLANIKWNKRSEPDLNLNKPGKYTYKGYIQSVRLLGSVDINVSKLAVQQAVVVEPGKEVPVTRLKVNDKSKLVEAGTLITILDTNSKIQLPRDLPNGTRLQVKSVDKVNVQGLNMAGEIFDYILTFPKGANFDQIKGNFILTLGISNSKIANDASIYQYNPDGGTWTSVGGEVVNQLITASVTDFSRYGVFVKEPDKAIVEDNIEQEDSNIPNKKESSEEKEEVIELEKSKEDKDNEEKKDIVDHAEDLPEGDDGDELVNKNDDQIDEDEVRSDSETLPDSETPETSPQVFKYLGHGLIIIIVSITIVTLLWHVNKRRKQV